MSWSTMQCLASSSFSLLSLNQIITSNNMPRQRDHLSLYSQNQLSRALVPTIHEPRQWFLSLSLSQIVQLPIPYSRKLPFLFLEQTLPPLDSQANHLSRVKFSIFQYSKRVLSSLVYFIYVITYCFLTSMKPKWHPVFSIIFWYITQYLVSGI